MRIAVNARWLEATHTGIGQYTLNLFKVLAKDHPQDKFTLVVRQKIAGKFPPNVQIKIIPEKKWLLFASLKKGYWEHCQLRSFFNKNKFDIVHFTYPAYPIRGINKPAITTIHDIIPWQDKRYRTKLRSKIYFWLTKKALKKCPQFLAVSQTTKDDFAREFKIPKSRITVTYEAVSPSYCARCNLPATSYNLPATSYLLYVGGYDPRKNVDKLIDLFEKLKNPNLTLVLAGGKIYKNKLYDSYHRDGSRAKVTDLLKVVFSKKKHNHLQKNTKSNKLNILKTGFISEKELNTLYQRAVAVINISGKEGFNLPLLESAYSGTPIITSDIPVHRELYAGYAILLPLNDNKKAIKTLKQFIQNPDLQEKYRQKTRHLREKYTWEKTSEKTYSSYRLGTGN